MKTSSSQNPNRASRSAPERVKRKQAIPRQDNIFKRFTTLVIDFFKQKFVWAKANKSQIDLISEEHDKRIAENYVFDEVLGRHISRAEYEKNPSLTKMTINQHRMRSTVSQVVRIASTTMPIGTWFSIRRYMKTKKQFTTTETIQLSC